jgi:hypothetical protein
MEWLSMTDLSYYFEIYLEELRKITRILIMTVYFPIEILAADLRNSN